jgi:uroporphyrinogen-III synthase
VTRPRPEAENLAAALAARGIGALIEPLITIHYAEVPTPDQTGVQALLCTSANGVRALARLSGERRLPLFAVGEASAAAARAAGFACVAGAGGDVHDLARLVGERLSPDGGRLLHVSGHDVAGDLAGLLQMQGFAVERTVLYEARPATTLTAATIAALAAREIDYALFFSPRTAAIFKRLATEAGLTARLSAVTAISISPAADAALAALPFHGRCLAARPDQPSLLAVLDHLAADRERQ